MTDEAKAVEAVATMTGKAIDVAAGAGRTLWETLQEVPKDLVGYIGGDALHERRLRNLAKLKVESDIYLERIAESRRTDASPSVVIPLLTAAADEERAELRNLWAKLLANAAIDGGRKVRREFFETIRQMETVDGIMLEGVWQVLSAKSFKLPTQWPEIKKHLSHQDNLNTPREDAEILVSLEALTNLRCLATKQGVISMTPYGRALIIALTVD